MFRMVRFTRRNTVQEDISKVKAACVLIGSQNYNIDY